MLDLVGRWSRLQSVQHSTADRLLILSVMSTSITFTLYKVTGFKVEMENVA